MVSLSWQKRFPKVVSLLGIIRTHQVQAKWGGLALVVIFIILRPNWFVDLWLSQDQQARVHFELQNYHKAAALFTDPDWQAYSLYAAEEFDLAAQVYGQINTFSAKFAQANALAHARRYVKARTLYRQLLNIRPNHPQVSQNLALVESIIDDINRLSEHQAAEEGDSSRELGDEPQAGDGAERKDMVDKPKPTLTAEQLLQDPRLIQMWLKQVQKDPSQFLQAKFQYQASEVESVGETR